jgi:Uma2 family endonuclease
MVTKTRATIEDLYNIPENGKAEIVNGEIVHMSPTGGIPNYAGLEISFSLHEYAKRTGLKGHAFGDNTASVVNLPNRKSFSPDAGFYVGDITMKFFEGAPVFAVEVRESDYGLKAERAMAAKRADYFAAGTQVVWDVDLKSEDVVRVYRADKLEQPTVYRRGDVAEAEPAVPGWTLPVDDLFVE